MLQTKSGRPMIMYKKYTFHFKYDTKNGKQWTCTARTTRHCKTMIATTEDFQVYNIKNEHNHEPPKYYVNKAGDYFKI